MHQRQNNREIKQRFDANLLLAIVVERSDATVNAIQSRMGAFGDIWCESCEGKVKVLLLVPVTVLKNTNLVAVVL